MSIDNSKLVLELFNYKKGLNLEQEDIENVVNSHLQLFNCDNTGKTRSQKSIVRSLTENLNRFGYDKSVKTLCENLNSTLEEDELFYELEDLYRTLENSNQGMVYRHPMSVVFNILSTSSINEKKVKILNELSQYNWIPSVKNFMVKFTNNPKDIANLTSDGGKCDAVYSIVEKVKSEEEEGFLSFIGEKWFMIKEDEISPSTPSNHINDREKLQRLGLLEKALRMGEFNGDQIEFEVDGDLTVGVSFKNGEIFLNGEKTDESTTIETVFESPLVSFMRKDLYPVIKEVCNNLENFVELDIVQKVSNISKTMEAYTFNYNEKMYAYFVDQKFGNTFYEYDSASMLVNEVKTQLGYDLSKFYENKFEEEVRTKRSLEEKEKNVLKKLSEINEGLEKIADSGLLENDVIKAAHEGLLEEKAIAEKKLFSVREKLTNNYDKKLA